MADPARLNLDQDLSLLRQLELDLFHREGPALLLEGGLFERLGEFGCHLLLRGEIESVRSRDQGLGVKRVDDDDDEGEGKEEKRGRRRNLFRSLSFRYLRSTSRYIYILRPSQAVNLLLLNNSV
jgi:hypothetical protein